MKLIIDGQPQGKGRPRHTRSGHTYTPPKTAKYEAYIKECYKEQIGSYMAFDGEEPLSVHIMAYFGITDSWTKKKKQMAKDNLLKPISKPDCDNILKVILDSLNGVAYHDDRYVTDQTIRKRYSTQPRVEVEIKEVKE